jgi:hypothetical protein
MSLPNNRLLHATVEQHITRCERGIDAHLAEFAQMEGG